MEQRAPQIEVASEGKAPKEVINIMAALNESMQAEGRQGAGFGAEANGQISEVG